MKKFWVLILIILPFSNIANARYADRKVLHKKHKMSGVGIFSPWSPFKESSNSIVKIPIYNQNEQEIGYIEVKTNMVGSADSKFVFEDKESAKKNFEPIWVNTGHHDISYVLAKVSQSQIEFENKVNPHWKVIVKKSDLYRRSSVQSWFEFMVKISGYLHSYGNYRIRKLPNINGEVVLKLREERMHKNPPYHSFSFTGKTNKNWAEVTVSRGGILTEAIDSEVKGSHSSVVKGWIQVVGEDGLPNFWFYSKGL